MSGPSSYILQVYDNSNPNFTVVVPAVAGGVLILDSQLNPSFRELLSSDIADLLNILALMKLNTAQSLSAVTGVTGGGTNFDNSPTANGVQTVGAVVTFTVSGIRYTYQLTGGTTSTSSPYVIQPLDYNVSTNQVYWALVSRLGPTLIAASGSNQKAGQCTLVAGTVSVANTAITAHSVVALSIATTGGTPGTATPKVVVTAGVGFVVTGLSTDTSTYNFVILEW